MDALVFIRNPSPVGLYMYCLIIHSAAASRHVAYLEFLANFKAQLPRGEQDAILVSRRRRRGLSKQKKRFKMMMRIRNIYIKHFSPNHLIRLLLSPEGGYGVYRLLLCDEPQEMNAFNFRALLLPPYMQRRGDVLIHQPKGEQELEIMSFHFRLGGIREREQKPAPASWLLVYNLR